MNRRTYPFLVADTQLYKRLCPSVGPSVGPSIGPSVMVIELKIGKTDIFAPAHPSATGGRVSSLVCLFVRDINGALWRLCALVLYW